MTERIAAVGRIVLATAAGFQRNQGSLMAAGLAYFLLVSASPLLVVAVAVVSVILGYREAHEYVRDRIEATIGPDAAASASELLQDVELFSGGLTATLIALAVLFYGSTRAFAALQGSFDVIWDCQPSTTLRRSILWVVRSRLVAFVMVVAVGVVALTTFAIETAGSQAQTLLERYMPMATGFGSIGNGIALFLVRALCLALVYRLLPSRKIAWRDVWPAALLSLVLLSSGHTLIRAYVAYGGVRSAYAAAGSFIVLLFLFYFAAFVVLLGAQFARACSDYRLGTGDRV